MPLVDLTLAADRTAIPRDIRAFLRTAKHRIARFQREGRAPGFMASDFECVYAALRGLAESGQAPGNQFCEWGSGFGVVACLAAMLDFDACGIEIDPDLADASRLLAEDFELPVEFVCGSFIPREAESLLDGGRFAWLSTDRDGSQGEPDQATDDFDVIFAYPWPDEEHIIERLFERCAGAGAVLVTYDGTDCRLRSKRG